MNAKETKLIYLKVAAILALVAISTRVLVLANEVQQEPGAQLISRSIDNANCSAASSPVIKHCPTNAAAVQTKLSSL